MHIKKLTTSLISSFLVVYCANVNADAFSMPDDGSGLTKELLERINELESRLLVLDNDLRHQDEAKRIEMDNLRREFNNSAQDSHNSTDAISGIDSKAQDLIKTTTKEASLNPEQEFALESATKTRYHVLGIVNGKHMIRAGNDVLLLNDKEYEQFISQQHELIKRALIKITPTISLDDFDPGVALDIPDFPTNNASVSEIASRSGALSSTEQNKEQRQQEADDARAKLEQRRQAAKQARETSRGNRSTTYGSVGSGANRSNTYGNAD